MTSAEVERYRAEFPVTRELIYFNHAGVAPLSRRVAEALVAFQADYVRFGALHSARWDEQVEACRGRFARLIGAQPEEVAFVKNTSEGLSHVALGLPWKAGDNVIISDLEFPANVYPWLGLEGQGVEVRWLRAREGRLLVDDLARLMDGHTRLVALSSVEFSNGFRVDLEAVGQLCQRRGCYFLVDAIQSLGALPLDVEACGIDFLAADGHKWLLSVEGLGGFYCSRRVADAVAPRSLGWKSVVDPRDFDTYHFKLQPHAGKFEGGSLNVLGIYALGAALALLEEVGMERIAARVLGLTDRLIEGLRGRGYEIVTPLGPGERSGTRRRRWSRPCASLMPADPRPLVPRGSAGNVAIKSIAPNLGGDTLRPR
ncbi:MAG: aminotransferase class V-fold PLP-dependent enzyme [Deltaproteobacteria bacterium]|nr:aminotransferase class V-fold PLP-dependent enzyme [Deltaproteobacteria bacterium]